jgi:outer membrane protein
MRVPIIRPAAWRDLLAAALALAAVLVRPASLGAQQQVVSRASVADSAGALSLDDAMRLALARSEVVRIAEAGVQRAQGQLLQARSQFLPQLNGTGAYQKTIKSQFNEIQKRFAPAPDAAPAPTPLCREADGTQVDCPSTDGFGAIGAIFASPYSTILGLTGSWNLFTGGRATAGYRASTAGQRAAETGLAAQQAQIRYDVAQAYFDAQLAGRLATIAESSYVQSERAFRQTSLARQVGNVSEFELLRARVTRDNVRPQVIQARTQRDVAVLRLRQLLDLPPGAPLRLTTDIEDGVSLVPPARLAADTSGTPVRPGMPLRAVSRNVNDIDLDELLAVDSVALMAVDSVAAASDTAAEQRSNVRQARENVEAQRQLLRVARGQRLPAVQLSTNYQRFAYPADFGLETAWAGYYPNWTVTLGVSVPLFTGGRIKGDEMVAQANFAEAKEQLQQAREVAALDASLAVAELRQAQASWNASLGTAEQAARAYTIAEVRFREGISTQLELSDTRVQQQQALASRAQAARNLQVARMRLALIRDLPFQLNQGGASGAASQSGAGQGGAAQSQQQGRQAPRAGAQQGAASTAGGASTGTSGTFQ